MKKFLLLVALSVFVLSGVFAAGAYAQGLPGSGGAQAAQNAQSAEGQSPAAQMDDAVRRLAGEMYRKLTAENVRNLTIGQFTLRGSTPPLGTYWINQLIEELVNIPQRPYTLFSPGANNAEWAISGEIVEVPGFIRIYTRLVRSEDKAVQAAFHSDFERAGAIVNMLSTGVERGSSRTDEWEPDSWDNPVLCEIGASENVPVMNRAIEPGGDEDFFLLVPERDGRLTMETTGSIDTYMEFYDAETREMLAEDDDGGSGSNARIRYNVEAGRRYIAKVRGYSGSTTGSYGFRAYMSAPREGASSMSNPMLYEIGVDDNTPVVNRTLGGGDEDFFLLLPANNGRLTMETTGRTDTYMEFYDAETRELLAEDDDGGQGTNARIRYTVQGGRRYIAKVRGYSSSEAGSYGFRAYLPSQARLAPDEYEPDDDPSQAGWIEIGTPQQHTFHTGDDVDWVKFEVTRPGRYIIRTRGANSNRLDTYIELFDAKLNSIAEDDDGGDDLDSRIAQQLGSGLYYLKVWCLDDEPNQPYIISVEQR